MNSKVTAKNRYLPDSVGVEVESSYYMMTALQAKLARFFPSGNSESSKIYELQTTPIQTKDPLDVVLLGEVVRRCIPNYVVGGSDNASASAHCHVVGFNYIPETEHIEALMIGLMPFLSMSWNRNNFEGYTFRASIVGMGSGYSKFTNASLRGSSLIYSDRAFWVRNQTIRHSKPAIEIRANENSPLWLYFITPLLNDQNMVDKLRAISVSELSKELYKGNRGKSFKVEGLAMYTELIEQTLSIITPFLLDAIPTIVENFKDNEKDFMTKVLIAYLTEDQKTYNTLVDGLIAGDDELTEFFKIINKEFKSAESTFNVLKDIK